MCCNNQTRERWVVGLVLLGCLSSLTVATCLLMVTHPGDECLLFVSVRGQSLIYGHPAGCRYVSAAHIMVILASLVFGVTLMVCTRRARSGPAGSNKTLRGSMTAVSVDGLRSKPTITLVVLSVLIMMFVAITAIVNISGYAITCSELQYETRRGLYQRQTLAGSAGSIVRNPIVPCWSILRDTDLHTRMHYDHEELNGAWYGQYTTYRWGRPRVWTGEHRHFIDLALGIELTVVCSTLSAVIWLAITTLLILHRRSVKGRNRVVIAESIEDAKIWAADQARVQQAAGPGHQYEMVARRPGTAQGPGNHNNPYESLAGSVAGRAATLPGPPSDASTVEAAMAHQSVIAHSHPEGSYFLTKEGTYVQLVGGVLTNVESQPVQQVPVNYMQLQFPPGQFGPACPPLANSSPCGSQPPFQPPSQPSSQPSSLGPSNPLTQPLMPPSEPQGTVSNGRPGNTRVNMRRQKDVAAMAGIKCSQF